MFCLIIIVENNLAEKYGEGVLLKEVCPTCGYEADDLPSAGVHENENGCVRVYAENEKFVCPQCPTDGKLCQVQFYHYHFILKITVSSLRFINRA